MFGIKKLKEQVYVLSIKVAVLERQLGARVEQPAEVFAKIDKPKLSSSRDKNKMYLTSVYQKIKDSGAAYTYSEVKNIAINKGIYLEKRVTNGEKSKSSGNWRMLRTDGEALVKELSRK